MQSSVIHDCNNSDASDIWATYCCVISAKAGIYPEWTASTGMARSPQSLYNSNPINMEQGFKI
ncbi:MAG: hypothetical protein A3F12_07865 [Gammaproteobacteria bacterium RIFCSPHIGHO2_12_FULL_38_14]|nr:MAG: hypothetical protein A3F12_07865 [Gammaproteobacteria bacterium RIFCSPHIGHO2_12_FULL_38_14]